MRKHRKSKRKKENCNLFENLNSSFRRIILCCTPLQNLILIIAFQVLQWNKSHDLTEKCKKHTWLFRKTCIKKCKVHNTTFIWRVTRLKLQFLMQHLFSLFSVSEEGTQKLCNIMLSVCWSQCKTLTEARNNLYHFWRNSLEN